jgi:hypothetical protein
VRDAVIGRRDPEKSLSPSSPPFPRFGSLRGLAHSRLTLILLWGAILVQLGLVFAVSHPWIRGDSGQYLSLADSLREGRYGSITSSGFQADALRPPAYPVFLWLLLHKAHLQIWAVVLLQLAMYAASILLLQRWLQKKGVSPALFLALAAIYPFTPMYAASVMTEAIATLAMTALAVLVAGESNVSWRKLALAGLIMGLVALVRTDLILLPVLVAAYLLTRSLFEREWKVSALVRAGIPIAVAALVTFPYALWNHATFGRATPLPIAGAVGNSLYLTVWQAKLEPQDLNALYFGTATENARKAGLADEVMRLNAAIGAPPLTAPWNPANYPTTQMQIRSTEVYREAALARIAAAPADYAGRVASNLWYLWNTSEYPENLPWFGRWILVFISAAATLAGLLGAAFSVLRVRNWPLPAAQALILLYPLAVHVWLHLEARYTAPVRLLLLVNAAMLISWSLARLRKAAGPAAGS